jgi:hypothetical protein
MRDRWRVPMTGVSMKVRTWRIMPVAPTQLSGAVRPFPVQLGKACFRTDLTHSLRDARMAAICAFRPAGFDVKLPFQSATLGGENVCGMPVSFQSASSWPIARERPTGGVAATLPALRPCACLPLRIRPAGPQIGSQATRRERAEHGSSLRFDRSSKRETKCLNI